MTANVSLQPGDPVWAADLRDGTFQNPVLYADYSDPDVIRVGEDFYMVSSSFSHMPGRRSFIRRIWSIGRS
ncbi:hypothetical protein LJK88_07315 [Paenibacillus sp. P26]|nr:hypothetical protein LJK88_07315 [Paenibacillus sp. P26]